MPTLRFEGASLEEAVEAARGRVGPTAKIVGAAKVRRGGVAGFFAHEHVEVEIQVEPQGAGAGEPLVTADVTDGDDAGRGPGREHRWGRPSFRRPSQAPDEGDELGYGAGGGDPMTELIEEMAQNGPSSVLDLAEAVNSEQRRFVVADGRSGPVHALPAQSPARQATPPGPAPRVTPPGVTPPGSPRSAARQSPGAPVTPPGPARSAPPKGNDGGGPPPSGFATVLERIARQENLVSPDHEDEILPNSWEPLAPPAPANHTGAILTDLAGDDPTATAVALWDDRSGPVHLPEVAPAPHLPEVAPAPHLPQPARSAPPASQRPLSDLVLALHGLGLPPAACPLMSPSTSRAALEVELRRALEAALPALAPMPRSAASVVAVVGPRGQVMQTARALAADLGTPKDEVALATQRNVSRQQDRVIASPEDAVEQRRSWRWRGHPSVVAIEVAVRPDGAGAAWAGAMLRAFEPTMCWGVAEASRKPEDVAAWSAALGGLDVLALVDLDGTTTPAAALTTSLPVGRLDGQPATPEVWARVLCSRLTAG